MQFLNDGAVILYRNYEGRYESNASFFFSETRIRTAIKFTYITGTPIAKLRLFFYRLSFIINIFFHLCVRRYGDRAKLCRSVQARHVPFVAARRRRPQKSVFRGHRSGGQQRWKSEGVKSGAVVKMRGKCFLF
jgi:hypothetical protein